MSLLKDQIASQLDGVTSGVVDLSFEIEKRIVHARLSLGPANATTMVTLFHGAVDFKSRTLPVFIDGFHGLKRSAHQLSLSDPSVKVESKTNMGWYAGEHDFDTPTHLHALVLAISEHLNVTRRLYFGTSGGGFAALAMSHRDSGSYAVVGNPQTSISQYRLGYAIQRYREAAWPEIADNDGFRGTPFGDLTHLYADGFSNTVIYVQNISDRPHFENHMMPFVAAIKDGENRDRLILNSEFHGDLGHVPTPSEYLTWMIAICTAPTDSIDDILMTRHALKKINAANPASASTKSGPATSKFSDRDLMVAKMLAPKA